MVYVDQQEQFRDINFLKSERFESFTQQVDDTHAQVEDGVIPAGSIYPANDTTAQGVTINDVDVSKGAQPVGVITGGHVLAERLPEAPTADALGSIRQVNFYDAQGNVLTADETEPAPEQ